MHVPKSKAPGPPSTIEAERVLRSKGFDTNEAAKWKSKYNNLRWNATNRGVQCRLTFEDYMRLAKKAKLTSPSSIGTGKGQYQMSRLSDSGDYFDGNCRFLTVEQNQIERYLNGGVASQAEKRRGRTKATHAGVAAQASKLLGRTKATHRGILSQSIKVSKQFKVRAPSGRTFKGKNLSEFCVKHNLTRQLMCAVCNGEANHHKGWTGTFL
jgi:hypothetical protein